MGWSAVKCLRQSEAPGRRGATGCSQIRGARARGAIKRQQAASATNVTSTIHLKSAKRGQAAILWRNSDAFALHMGGKQSLHVPLPSSSSSTDYTHRPRKTYRNSSVSWQQHQNTTQCIRLSLTGSGCPHYVGGPTQSPPIVSHIDSSKNGLPTISPQTLHYNSPSARA